MILAFTTFGDSAASALGALGLNVQSFLFQLITFILLLLILRRFAFPPIVKTLEERRKAVEQSIDQAKEAAAALASAEKQVEQTLREARDQAEELVAAGHREATKMIEAAEAKATKRAESIIRDAHVGLEHQLAKAREALKHEAAQLIAEATGSILKEKIDAKKDAELISGALRSATKHERETDA